MVLELNTLEIIVIYVLRSEDKSFIKKFMTKQGQTIFKPALASEIFSKDDFIN